MGRSMLGNKEKKKRSAIIVSAIIFISILIIGIAALFIYDRTQKEFEDKKDDFLIESHSILETATDYKGHWAEESFVYMISNKYMNGTSSNTIDPDGALTRAQYILTLFKIDNGGLPIIKDKIVLYNDVLDNFYYTDAINWGSSNDIMKGISVTQFIPNYLITREQALSVLFNYHVKRYGIDKNYKLENVPYTDMDNVPDYAKDAVRWAYAEKLIPFWDDEILESNKDMTRAEMAVLLHNYCKRYQITNKGAE